MTKIKLSGFSVPATCQSSPFHGWTEIEADKPSHTSGPWEYSPAVASVFGPAGTCPQVCTLPAFGGNEGTANGHLIASAPDLLAFLVEFVNSSPIDCSDDDEFIAGYKRGALRLIAKAQGGAK